LAVAEPEELVEGAQPDEPAQEVQADEHASEDFRSAWITILDLSREASPGAYLPRFANI
jgi:hypothetical protein